MKGDPITGVLAGTFFGPDATQIGGYFQLTGIEPAVGGFVAVKDGP